MLSRLIAVLLIILLGAWSQALIAGVGPGGASIVVLHAQHMGFPVVDSIGQGILSAIRDAGISVADINMEYLDFTRNPDAEHRQVVTRLMALRLRGKRVAIVFAQGKLALDYVLGDGRALFPDAVIMTSVPEFDQPERLQGRKLIHTPWRADFGGTLGYALELYPKTRRVLVMAGAASDDVSFAPLLHAGLAPFANRVALEYTDALGYDEMLARLAAAGEDTLVLLTPYFGDARGRTTVPVEVAKQVGALSPRPVFVAADPFMSFEVLGGSMLDTQELGRRIGVTAVDYMAGKLVLAQPVTTMLPTYRPVFKWPQLERWGIDPASLPPGSVFVDRPPALWEQYRAPLIGGAFAVLTLFSLSVLMQSRRRHRAEQAASASEARSRVMIDAAPEAILSLDVDADRIIDANANALKLFGCDRELLLQGGLRRFYRAPGGDEHTLDASERDMVQRALAGSVVVMERIVQRACDGEEMDCEARFVMLPYAGQHILRATFTDVSLRKAIESALYFVAQRATVGTVTHRTFAAELAGFLCGTLRMDHAVWVRRLEEGGHEVLGAVGDGMPLAVAAADVAMLVTARPSGQRDGTEIVSSGARSVFPGSPLLAAWQAESVVITSLWDAAGSGIGFIVVAGRRPLAHPERALSVLRVVAVRAAQELEGMRTEAAIQRHQDNLEQEVRVRTAELGRANEALTRALDAAESATRAKSEFLANMSHEIRTPMNAIIGMTALALRGPLESKERNYLNKAATAADSLLTLLNDILDFSKIEAGKLELEQRAFDLAEVVFNVVTMFGARAAEKGLELLVQIAPDVPAGLCGDPLRLGQVLMNLCGNAIKFSEQGEVLIGIGLVSRTGCRVRLHFAVVDQGIGMDEAQLGRLFKAFSQADASHARRFGGTGLGLAISKQLVELMGGRIGASSWPGQGSAFEFTAEFEVQDDAVHSILLAPDIRKKRVLVVDDSATATEIALALLARLGMVAESADSGERALARLQGGVEAGAAFDVVLLDWRLPGHEQEAWQVRIRECLPPHLQPRIVLVSTYGNGGSGRQPVDEAVDAILAKPLNAAELVDALEGLFHPEAAESLQARARKLPAQATPAIEAIRGMRVLLVEDNPVNQLVASDLLTQAAGVWVVVAGSGEEALARLHESDFDLALMDVQMPGMDGYETTRLIRQEARWQDLPIVAMTAHAMRRDRENCLAAGMNDFISKPFDFARLCEMLARWRGARPMGEAVVGTAPIAEAPAFTLPGVDVAAGLSHCNQISALYQRILKAFLKEQATACRMLREALLAGDRRTAGRVAHTLKSSAATVGAVTLAEAARSMEVRLDEGAVVGPDDAGLRALEDALQIVIGGLEAHPAIQPGSADARPEHGPAEGP